MKDAKDALERELNSSVNGVQSLSCESSPSSSTGTKSRKRTKNKRLDGYETINGVYKPFTPVYREIILPIIFINYGHTSTFRQLTS